MKAENPAHALALVLSDTLARLGLTDTCLAPGSRSAALAMAINDDDRIRVHVGVDERSAAFLALGLARASGVPAAVLTTSGTAAANLHPAVIEASASRVPLIVLTADRPAEMRDTGANQAIDQTHLYGRAVRWFAEVPAPEDRAGAPAYWRSVTLRAWAEAVGAGGPPGPVHLNVAFREPLVPAEVDSRGTSEGGFSTSLETDLPIGPMRRGAREPDARDVDDLAAMLADVERGVVVAGEGSGGVGALADLGAHIGWPLLAEPLSGARHGTAISAYPYLLGHEAFTTHHPPQAVLRAGRAGLSRSLLELLGRPTDHHVLIDPDAAWLDPTRSIHRVVAADPAAVASLLVDAVPQRVRSDWLDGWRAADAAVRAAVNEVIDADERMSEPRAARDLVRALPGGAALVVGSSMPVRDLDLFMEPRDEIALHGNRGASGIDGFVSTALGVALAHGGSTFALCGDLTLLHDINGLLHRPDGEAALTLVVVNNDGGGMFSFLPQAEFPEQFERLFGTPHGLDLAAVLRAYGASHRLVEHADDLAPALEEPHRDGVRVLEIRTDRDENLALHRRIEEAARSALDTLLR